MDYKRLLSYIASIAVFVSTAVMLVLFFAITPSGQGITTAQFMPIRNTMFAIGIPCFIKFYISSDKDYKENKAWLLGYGVCFIGWVVFIFKTVVSAYFANIRTMCIASFVLMLVAMYLQYSMTDKKE